MIALPDTGPRVLTFSAEHGPGAVDAVGAGLLLTGFGFLLTDIWQRRRAIVERFLNRPGQLVVQAFVAGLGTGLLVAGVFTDFWWWWLVGSVILQAFWLSIFVAGYRQSEQG